jgi:hypothetical protein
LENLTNAQTIPSGSLALAYDGSGNVASISYTGAAQGILPDGDYRLTILAAGVSDRVGFALDGDANGSPGGDYRLGFFFLNGDANRDRSVNIADFSILAGSFNTTGTFSNGDFDFNGVVGLADFALLASKFNTSLPDPLARPASVNGVPPPTLATAPATAFGQRRIVDSLVSDVLA